MDYPYIQERDADKYRCHYQPGGCVASNCMAWRWKSIYAKQTLPNPPKFEGYSKTLGYCGSVKG